MIYIACDHNGVELKNFLITQLSEMGLKVEDVYTQTAPMDDYPVVASILAEKLKNLDEDGFGIAICGTGQGICMAMNRYSWVRSACAESQNTASKVKAHNHANCLCFGGWQATNQEQKMEVLAIIKSYMQTPVDNSPRHLRRIEQLKATGNLE
jgi:ribose 5-phosphate isomerase B